MSSLLLLLPGKIYAYHHSIAVYQTRHFLLSDCICLIDCLTPFVLIEIVEDLSDEWHRSAILKILTSTGKVGYALLDDAFFYYSHNSNE